MAYKTDIDELVNYSYTAKTLILNNDEIMGLIANDPNYDPDGDDAEQFEERVKDHDYVDETALTSGAYVCIETEMVSLDSHSMKTMYLYVNIVCQKNYMELERSQWKGYKGNRRDNIARLINNLLNENPNFGVGDLRLISATLGSVPSGFTSRILTYKVPAFADHV